MTSRRSVQRALSQSQPGISVRDTPTPTLFIQVEEGLCAEDFPNDADLTRLAKRTTDVYLTYSLETSLPRSKPFQLPAFWPAALLSSLLVTLYSVHLINLHPNTACYLLHTTLCSRWGGKQKPGFAAAAIPRDLAMCLWLSRAQQVRPSYSTQ